MFGSIGSILSGAGALAGALGQGRGQTVQQSQSGFASLPKELQDYLKGDIFSRIKAYGQTPFATVPYRRIGAAELDPIFGSKALRDLQRLNDQRVMRQFARPSGGGAMPSAERAASNMAREFLTKNQGDFEGSRNPISAFQKADQGLLEELLSRYYKATGSSAVPTVDKFAQFAASGNNLPDYFKMMGM